MNWKTLATKYLSRHPYFTARVDKCETPDGRIVDEYFVVELPPSVCAVAITRENEVLMVKQYRHPIEKTILELPGGFVDEGELPEVAIARELQEETGYTFSSITPLGKIAANPGVLNNFTYFYLAKEGEQTSEQKFDRNEFLLLHKVSIPELKKLLLENRIEQSLHATCILYALLEMGLIKS